jgi:phospholipid/cholesterol/gamma-HCH transport system substrate-binding protein
VLTVLRRDSAATSTLLREGGLVFSALSSSPAQLQGFIRNSNAVFAATAAQDVALANTVRAFPAFTVATRQTIARVARFAHTTKPLIDELRPAAVQLGPALKSVAVLAPELRDLVINVAPLTAASKTGVPALEQFLTNSVPWLKSLSPYLGNLVPVVEYINTYRREIAAFFANSTTTTQATALNINQTHLLHYLRISNPVNPEVLTNYQKRLSSNRANPYMAPGGYTNLLHGLFAFGSYLCTPNPLPTIGPTIPANLMSILRDVYFTSDPSGPPCKAQAPLGTAATPLQHRSFPHLQPLP